MIARLHSPHSFESQKFAASCRMIRAQIEPHYSPRTRVQNCRRLPSRLGLHGAAVLKASRVDEPGIELGIEVYAEAEKTRSIFV